MINSVIELDNVSYSYRNVSVLEDIDLKIARGQFVGVIGPNGSGKTTLLKVILGLIKPQKGNIRIFGKEKITISEKKKIGYVPQKAQGAVRGFPITVSEVVSLGLVPDGLLGKTKNVAALVDQALQSVAMYDHKNRLINELSGGQQQRVFIARAIVSKPELLILDEPTVGVDIESQSLFYALLRKLKKEHNLTLILVSHDIDVVAHEVDEIACINSKLICHGKPKDVLTGDFMEQLYGKELKFIIHGH